MNKATKEWLEALIEAGIIILIMFLFFWPVKVQGTSMKNTLEDGDRVIVNRVLGTFEKFEKGDIIVFKYNDGNKEIDIIKRIIADEGDCIKIQNDKVWINGTEIHEDYIIGETYGDIELVVPKDELFVMGDNRSTSEDSRNFGTIKKDDVVGRMIFKIYPFSEISVVK